MDKILTVNGKIATGGGRWITGAGSTPLPPIAPYTMRVRFYGEDENFNPNSLINENWELMGTWTNIVGSVWDFTYQNENWYGYGYQPNRSGPYLYGVWSLKSKSTQGTTGLYKYANTHAGSGLPSSTDLLTTKHIDILGANLTGVKNIPQLFARMTNIRNMTLFDTSMICNASEMFQSNGSDYVSVPIIPNFNFSHVNNDALMWGETTLASSIGKPGLESFAYFPNKTSATDKAKAPLKAIPDIILPADPSVSVSNMFRRQYNVESGALSLYNKFSAAGWTGSHSYTFSGCGDYTTTGAAERAQIPTDWGGTMA